MRISTWIATALVLAMSAAATAAEPKMRLIVPAYMYPADDGMPQWTRLFDASKRVPVVAIVNPASGPGKAADANYTRLFERAGKTPLVLIGYVSTDYANRPIADVKAEVDRWMKLYPNVKGIFFDQQASGADALDYYTELYKYVRMERKLDLVVTNPGTTCSEDYFKRPALDIGNLYEGVRPPRGFSFPEWTGKYRGHSSMLVYRATSDDMRACCQVALDKNIDSLFVSDGNLRNPWNHLPPYLSTLVLLVEEANSKR